MASSQIAAIVAAAAVILASVPGIQRVRTDEPVATAPGQIPSTMGTSQDIHYWSVRPETTQPTRFPGYQLQLNHVVVMRGYLSVGDVAVSTPAVDALVLAVQTRFDLVFSIDPAAEVTGPMQTTWPRHLLLAETFLVHGLEFRLPVQELLVVQ